MSELPVYSDTETGPSAENSREQMLRELSQELDTAVPREERQYGNFMGNIVTVERSDGTVEENDWAISRVVPKADIIAARESTANPEYTSADSEEPYHIVEVQRRSTNEQGQEVILSKDVPLDLLMEWQKPKDQEPAPTEATTSQEALPENREVSPTGSGLLRAASRINAILERRAVNKAHGQALKEYRERDHDAYMDHIGGMRDSQNVSLAANEYATRTARREHLITDIKDIPDNIRRKVVGVGRAGIAIALGAGLAGANSAQRGYENAKQSAVKFNEAVGDGMMAAGAKIEQGLDAAGQKAAEKVTSVKERYSALKNAALERRAARRAKWANRFNSIKQGYENAADKVHDFVTKDTAARAMAGETIESAAKPKHRTSRREAWAGRVDSAKERAADKVRVYRSAGEAAMAAYRRSLDAQKNPQ